jgi:serine/threonine protein kinase
VEKKANKRIYALKVMKKDFLIKSNVVAHTIAEKEILRKIKHPFLIGLHYAFQTEGTHSNLRDTIEIFWRPFVHLI